MKMNAPKNESQHERFKRLATARTKMVLDKLRVLGNCSNTSAYEYSEEDIRAIFLAIDNEVKRVKAKFSKPVAEEFKL